MLTKNGLKIIAGDKVLIKCSIINGTNYQHVVLLDKKDAKTNDDLLCNWSLVHYTPKKNAESSDTVNQDNLFSI